jgi:uncharacterized protein (TIGR02145 family)
MIGGVPSNGNRFFYFKGEKLMRRLMFYSFLTTVISLLSLSTIAYSGTFTDTFDDPVFTNNNWVTAEEEIQQVWTFPPINGTNLGYHASTTSISPPAAKIAHYGIPYYTSGLSIETLMRINFTSNAYSSESYAGVGFALSQENRCIVSLQLDFDGPTEIKLQIHFDGEDIDEIPVSINFDTFYKLVVQVDSNNDISAYLYELDGTLLGSVFANNILSIDSGDVGIFGTPEVTFDDFKLVGNPVGQTGSLSQTQITQIYVATFNRAPDAGGLNFWANASGLTIEQIAKEFFKAPETQRKYPEGTTDAAFVNTIYQNVFGRDAEQAGIDYWVNVLGNGWRTRDQMIMTVIEGARNKDLQVLQNKTEVGLYYAEEVGENHVDGYKFSLANITDDPATVFAAMVVVNGFDDEPVPSSPCGAFVAPGIWKEFDCYNLAAIGKTTGDDPFTPSWRLIGGYWQWGRKGPDPSMWHNTNTLNFAHGPTGPSAEAANESEINGWDETDAPDGSWSDTVKTANDPCPAGYRVPTITQWNGVIANNILGIVGTWSATSTDLTNYTSARFFGDGLMMPTAGGRSSSSGALYGRGRNGDYWSSTQGSDSHKSWTLGSDSSDLGSGYANRRNGRSVRCVRQDGESG